VRAAKHTPGREGRWPGLFGTCFSGGLVPTDFALDVARDDVGDPNRRSRSPVAQGTRCRRVLFRVLGPFGKPVIHWADVDEKGQERRSSAAGFFCRLDEAGAYYGFLRRTIGARRRAKATGHRF